MNDEHYKFKLEVFLAYCFILLLLILTLGIALNKAISNYSHYNSTNTNQTNKSSLWQEFNSQTAKMPVYWDSISNKLYVVKNNNKIYLNFSLVNSVT